MVVGDPVHSSGDRSLKAVRSEDVELRSCVSQAVHLAMGFTESFRGLGSLLPILDRCRLPSTGSQQSRDRRCNIAGDDTTLYRRTAIDCLSACCREPAVSACDSPCSCSSDCSSNAVYSPWKTFQVPDPPYAVPSQFMASYQDLNCSRVAAFVDVAAAPSLLASCKNGAFSPSPAPNCRNAGQVFAQSTVQLEQDDAFPTPVVQLCLLFTSVCWCFHRCPSPYIAYHQAQHRCASSCCPDDRPVSEAAETCPQAGWQLMTFAIVLSTDPAAASMTVKRLLDDGALWSLDTTRHPVVFMIAVLAIIDLLSFVANFRVPSVLQPVVPIISAVWSATLGTVASLAFTMLQLLIALVCMR